MTGHDDTEVARAEAFVRQQIAFYGSTPAYRPVLDLHTFAVVASPADLGGAIRARYGELADRVSLYTPFQPTAEDVAALTRDLA